METVVSDVGQGLLIELECPICMEYMLPPISLCQSGHSICSICKPKLTYCPTCGQQLLNTRNVALEKLARQMKYPCTHRKYGCKETLSFDLIADHNAMCRYGQYPCPLYKFRALQCSWTGNARDVKEHLKETHEDTCWYYNGKHLVGLNDFRETCDYIRLIFAYNEVFCRLLQIKEGVFKVALLYFGPFANASKFRYKLKFVNNENAESIAVSHTARSVYESLEDIFNSGNCIKLLYDVVKRFSHDDRSLTFEMEIFGSDN